MRPNSFRILVLLYLLLILALSKIPGYSVSYPRILSVDKLLHILEYSILGFLMVRSLNRISKIPIIIIITGSLIFASIDEMLQSFTPGRSTDVYDFIADAVGIFLGLILTITIVRNNNYD
ncbi:MAG: VanZ family protein [Candidatus Neomarinimicrobiota bacterium]